MDCLIVAAGQGSRLQSKGPLKPLVTIGGAPLIEHVIRSARAAGATRFTVVSGYEGERLRAALDAFAGRSGLTIGHVINDAWRGANGLSVLKAREAMGGRPFLLTMCDHLADPAIMRGLIAAAPVADSVTLGVDYNVDAPLNDPEDATRVLCEDGRILAIGKLMARYNAFDTGIFLCTAAFFPALEASAAAGDDSISGAMRVLAGQGRALAHDIGDRPWIDVDDEIAYGKAEALLAAGRL